MKTIDTIFKNIENNKDLNKLINENYKYHDCAKTAFIDDAKTYVKAIKNGRMLCSIPHVSKSGMSRVLKFNSCEKTKSGFYYRQYFCFFTSLGYKENKNHSGFNISGCGMDMVFHTNYSIMHNLKNLGIITKKECEVLAQKTPTVL